MADSITIHNEKDFEGMRKAGNLAAKVLDFITPYVKPGVTTLALNDLCHNFIIEHGAKSAILNYRGFPKSICTSINHVICHGIPSDDKKLSDSDVMNIDVTVIVDGYYGDSSRMYYVGDKVPIKGQRLTKATYECMLKGIELVKPGANLNSIGKAIEEHAKNYGFSVVRDFCGHGIGKVFHAVPNVLHYYDPKLNLILQKGMFFTVEPMINAGSYESKVLSDGWTAVTKDKSLSCQFEHTIAVTEEGYEIFTLSPKGYTLPPYRIHL
jgi:methionyl aminopeptidase